MIVESFLAALTNADQDGRIVVTKKTGTYFAVLCIVIEIPTVTNVHMFVYCAYVCVLCVCV